MLLVRFTALLALAAACYGCQFDDPYPSPVALRADASPPDAGDVDGGDTPRPDAEPDAEPDASIEPSVPPPIGESRYSWVIGTSEVDGRPIIGELFGEAGPLLFLVSAIHGNELITQSYAERIRIDLLGGLAERFAARVFFVSLANPEGRITASRASGGGIDLNRNFPAEVGGTVAASGDPIQGETRALIAALEFADPSAVVSVHCCGPTFDPDGSGGPLADKMREALLRSGVDYPELDLEAFTGSMGSYASVALALPTVTVEFAGGEQIDTSVQLEAMREATAAAIEYTRAKGAQSSIDPEAAPFPTTDDAELFYRSGSVGATRSDLPIRSEWSGSVDDRRVLLLSGLSGASQRGEFVAEYVRRDLLHRTAFGAPDLSTQYVTQLNPDAVFSTDDAPFDELVEAVEAVDLDHPEARALLSLIGDASRGVTVIIEDGEPDAIAVDGPRTERVVEALGGLAKPGLDEISNARAASLVSALSALGVTVVYMQIATEHFEDQRGPTNPPTRYLDAVEILRALEPETL